MATTPPPTRARTPPAPLHGPKYDTRDAFSSRRSTRISAREKALASPPLSSLPVSHSGTLRSMTGVPNLHRRPSRTTFEAGEQPPVSPTNASDKDLPLATQYSGTMLPTPAKTPRKRTVDGEAKLNPTARVLFPSRPLDLDDAMPTPRRLRRGTKYTAFRPDDLEDNGEDGPGIQVYTDSRDRIPEVDEDKDNPFVVRQRNGTNRSRTTNLDRRTSTSTTPKHGMSKEIDQAVENGEGIVYVFRGKKIFRKFNDKPDSPTAGSESPEDSTIARRAGLSSKQHLTRSSVKPRLLFPPKEEQMPTRAESDEEALTDIEDPDPAMISEPDETATTPVKQRSFISTMTPPTTGRKPRSARTDFFLPTESPPSKAGAKHSPFDGWQRTKPGLGVESTGKRPGEPIERQGIGAGKRTRSRDYTNGKLGSLKSVF